MKRKLVLLLGILGVVVSALAFTATNTTQKQNACPLWGTPDCPAYPACCNK